ncbi:MAG: DUF4038 domain-containing protein [Calditrichaeota bacterium]|nr:MAG: DUF4038 domain-containing protein [Calditrichota bacterium]
MVAVKIWADTPWQEHGRLGVSVQNPHYLACADGSPFFWLGDTAWELFHCLNREDALFYLQNRAAKEFNVIQAVIIAERDGVGTPNAYGDLPFIDKNPLKPMVTPGNDPDDQVAYDYFDHVDYIIQQAQQLGLYIGLLPCWGEYVIPRESRGIFNTAEQTYGYGHFIGERFGRYPNIIWILGGDRQPDERLEGIELWRAMAEGIADGVNGNAACDGYADYSSTLMTHHAYNSSSIWFHNDPWIDFHAWGSYHADFYIDRAYTIAEMDWALPQPKPTLNAEPAYEDHPVNYHAGTGYFTAFDVRQIAYWSVFAGTCGHTYGAHPIWQFYRVKGELSGLVRNDWKTALDFDGAQQMKFLKRLILSRPMSELTPDQSLIISSQANGSGHLRAIRGKRYAFIYIPTGATTTVQMGKISATTIIAWWYDPRSGAALRIGDFPNSGRQTFDPPGISQELAWLQTGRGCDWVLVLDDAEADFAAPGDR